MGRRIKENPSVHRKRIAASASILFENKGIDHVSMDMIANLSGYSKATLYVFFESKEEIVAYLTLESMKLLKVYLEEGIINNTSIMDKYYGLCRGLEKYALEYPLYFKRVLEPINIDFNNSKYEESEKETFKIGEEINTLILNYINEGIKDNIFKENTNSIDTIFNIWGMLSGVIQLGISKEEYISKVLNEKSSEFMSKGYRLIYEGLKK